MDKLPCLGRVVDAMSDKESEPQTVSDKIIDKFLKSLAAEKGFEETATRLRKTIFENNTTAEKPIRDALFGENEA